MWFEGDPSQIQWVGDAQVEYINNEVTGWEGFRDYASMFKEGLEELLVTQ